jgi:hypothetical protein
MSQTISNPIGSSSIGATWAPRRNEPAARGDHRLLRRLARRVAQRFTTLKVVEIIALVAMVATTAFFVESNTGVIVMLLSGSLVLGPYGPWLFVFGFETAAVATLVTTAIALDRANSRKKDTAPTKSGEYRGLVIEEVDD